MEIQTRGRSFTAVVDAVPYILRDSTRVQGSFTKLEPAPTSEALSSQEVDPGYEDEALDRGQEGWLP